MYGNGQSTLCLFYNATGDTLRYVTNHDWYGYIDSRAEYPAEVGNGQWAAFLHVHRQGEPSGSVGAVVYRGKKKDGQYQEYMLAWSTPWGFYYRNKVHKSYSVVNCYYIIYSNILIRITKFDKILIYIYQKIALHKKKKLTETYQIIIKETVCGL